jgi:thioredoxin reductase (NADPH)
MSNPSEPRFPIFETRRAQALPRLDQRQLADLMRFGERRRYAAGEVLFAEGDRHVGLFVVLDGRIEITRTTIAGEERLISYEAGDFAGEVGLITGRAAIASARASEDCEVLAIDAAGLHRVIVTHAELSELILRAFILRRVAMLEATTATTALIGSRLAGATHRLRQFLRRNAQPHVYLDIDADADTRAVLERFALTESELPVVITGKGQVLRDPTIRTLAEAIGLSPDPLDGRRVDVAVIGAGPAGLAAAVYAASEGLSVVVVDAEAPGGQAGTSSRIENYFGFPTGISGDALAGRGFVQAEKFGADIAIPRIATGFECGATQLTVKVDDAERVTARCVVVATGAHYRKPKVENLEAFEGRGVYYAATFMEAQSCADREVIVVGGGNSAGQAAVFLAAHARHVHVLVRAAGLAASMSDYLVQRIARDARITLHTETELVSLHGGEALADVRWRNRRSGALEDHAIEHVFLFCGAIPNTDWLQDCLALDNAGFVKTGVDLTPEELREAEWPLERVPLRLETSHPGVFAVGDVRSGSVKRVAAAVGEGSTAVQLIHLFLAEQAPDAPPTGVADPPRG